MKQYKLLKDYAHWKKDDVILAEITYKKGHWLEFGFTPQWFGHGFEIVINLYKESQDIKNAYKGAAKLNLYLRAPYSSNIFGDEPKEDRKQADKLLKQYFKEVTDEKAI